MPQIGKEEPFQGKGGGSPQSPSPVQDREAHARELIRQLTPITAAIDHAAERGDLTAAESGVYVEVVSRPREPLATDSLERRSTGIELLSVRAKEDTTRATLFIPVSARDALGDLVEKYRTRSEPRSKTGEPKHRKLVEGIAAFHLAHLQELWTDSEDRFPAPGWEIFWETWLRPNTEERFRETAKRLGIAVGPTGLAFPETTAVRVTATREQMAQLVTLTLSVSQVRLASTTAEFFDSISATDQHAFAQELKHRVTYAPRSDDSTRICLLDTGVNRGHPLIAPALDVEDCHAANPAWGEDDHHGHGTELAGIALFGDLVPLLDRNNAVELKHRLESVKIIPPAGKNPHDLLGSVTRDAVNIAELYAPDARRVYCLASTTGDDTPHFGLPTSWSAELDQLAAGVGRESGPRRLFCVSAGNLRKAGPEADDYPDHNDAEGEAESPAHAWNVISVGACTHKTILTDSTLAGHWPMAPEGDLSPNSRTASWDGTWPITPDIVLEGGNLAVDPQNRRGWTTADLGILTTSSKHPNPVFTYSMDTSAATAEAARLIAILHDQYPSLWPETLRGLLIGSAEWTPAMHGHLPEKPRKSDYVTLLRRYGHGIPDLGRARHSASNLLTLIVQDDLQPYCLSKSTKSPVLNEMKLFRLPWPREALESLPSEMVRMRVTLSYFVEPNPSETQRNRKARYASHGLRFRMKLPDETEDAFRKRINKAALADGEPSPSGSDSNHWRVGSDLRDVGSIHSDTWIGYASDLARCGTLAVFPVGGWWKERKHMKRWESRARFSLIITIDAGETELDIYTPVETAVRNMTTITT